MKLTRLQPRIAAQPDRLKTISSDSWRAGKQTAAQRGYGYQWQKARASYLQAHPLCVMCQANGRVELATVVDHIAPHRGDMALFWDSANWQALCKVHHDGEKKRQEQGS